MIEGDPKELLPHYDGDEAAARMFSLLMLFYSERAVKMSDDKRLMEIETLKDDYTDTMIGGYTVDIKGKKEFFSIENYRFLGREMCLEKECERVITHGYVKIRRGPEHDNIHALLPYFTYHMLGTHRALRAEGSRSKGVELYPDRFLSFFSAPREALAEELEDEQHFRLFRGNLQ